MQARRSEMKRGLFTSTFATALALAGVVAASAQEEPGAKLAVASSPEHGAYIADGQGRALYALEADQRGQGEEEAMSNCYDACAEVWPPLMAQEPPPEAGPEVQADLVATFERRDGNAQVSYGGWPLYYYVKDQGAGKTTGHEVTDSWGEWYLVSPNGELVGH
jgi:predicted lipoprotein with Yx(FWY)xxD motif